jgi:hypothetical protein
MDDQLLAREMAWMVAHILRGYHPKFLEPKNQVEWPRKLPLARMMINGHFHFFYRILVPKISIYWLVDDDFRTLFL